MSLRLLARGRCRVSKVRGIAQALGAADGRGSSLGCNVTASGELIHYLLRSFRQIYCHACLLAPVTTELSSLCRTIQAPFAWIDGVKA